MYAIPASLLDQDTYLYFKRTVEARDRRKYHVPYSIFAELCSKSGTSTLRDVWFKQLNCVRGVSAEKAQTIVQKYPTPKRYVYLTNAIFLGHSMLCFSFIDALRMCRTTEDRSLLLKALNGPIQRQNLGEVLRRKIVDLFFASEYTDEIVAPTVTEGGL